jgi:hypothetical protein
VQYGLRWKRFPTTTTSNMNGCVSKCYPRGRPSMYLPSQFWIRQLTKKHIKKYLFLTKSMTINAHDINNYLHIAIIHCLDSNWATTLPMVTTWPLDILVVIVTLRSSTKWGDIYIQPLHVYNSVKLGIAKTFMKFPQFSHLRNG